MINKEILHMYRNRPPYPTLGFVGRGGWGRDKELTTTVFLAANFKRTKKEIQTSFIGHRRSKAEISLGNLISILQITKKKRKRSKTQF